MPLYHTPDIRTQTIDQARERLEAKRVNRMVQLATYQQQQSEKLSRLHGAELEKFSRQAERVDKAIDAVQIAIDKAQAALDKLANLNTNVTNIEQEIGNL